MSVVGISNNGLVPSRNYGIVSGYNGWVSQDSNFAIAAINSSYFAAMVCVSQYNSEAKVFIVSIGSDKKAKVSVISGSGTDISFNVVDDNLHINGAYDKNVSVILLRD